MADGMARAVEVVPFGDAAVLVLATDGDLASRAAHAAALAELLGARLHGHDGWGTPTPGVGGVAVPFDPERIDVAEAVTQVRSLSIDAAGHAVPDTGRTVDIQVRYGGEDGPDLAAVAEAVGLRPDEVARLHAGTYYRVLVLGFLPGFAYLGPLPRPLASVGRRASPRSLLPIGSVAVAAGMTAVYPSPSPGGWHVIGRTDAVLWIPERDPPNVLSVGDRVRFVPVETG